MSLAGGGHQRVWAENEHVLKEECERNKRKCGKTRLRVDDNTRNGVNCWDPVSEVMESSSQMYIFNYRVDDKSFFQD